MATQLSLLLLFGGASPEHEISILSARNIFAALDQDRYQLTLVGISRSGQWYELEQEAFLAPDLEIGEKGKALMLVPGAQAFPIRYLDGTPGFPQPDVAFPVTHGPNGEDGSLQGLLRQLNVPFVGPDVAASAAAMDKDMCKRLLREADLLVAEGFVFHQSEKDSIDFAAVRNRIGLPVFIKPANMGSSVGVGKAETYEEFQAAITEAFRYDHKVLVEEAIIGRELECAVMGNEQVESTGIGEIDMSAGFYSYDAKYESPDAAKVIIPAPDLDPETLAKLISVARGAYQAVCCEGLSRVDMFLCEDGRVYVNEINTLPGFTNISMYPKLWGVQGLAYSDLIDRLVELALQRGKRTAQLAKGRN